jgi:hypothetical protein
MIERKGTLSKEILNARSVREKKRLKKDVPFQDELDWRT